jgi:hypothetical protein
MVAIGVVSVVLRSELGGGERPDKMIGEERKKEDPTGVLFSVVC